MSRRGRTWAMIGLVMMGAGCSGKPPGPVLKPTAFGVALVESSGGKQVGPAGSLLGQPLVLQVNDEQGNALPGAAVEIAGPPGVSFDPRAGLTDSSGQFTTNVTLGGIAGRYQLTATTITKQQKKVELKVEEIAFDYQQGLGQEISEKYCARCHDPESSPERVSNFDNLEIKPHAFAEGDFLNKVSDADLEAIISHGGAAVNQSSLMPAYGYTLSKAEIQALISYIRLVSDPPYRAPGMVYVQK